MPSVRRCVFFSPFFPSFLNGQPQTGGGGGRDVCTTLLGDGSLLHIRKDGSVTINNNKQWVVEGHHPLDGTAMDGSWLCVDITSPMDSKTIVVWVYSVQTRRAWMLHLNDGNALWSNFASTVGKPWPQWVDVAWSVGSSPLFVYDASAAIMWRLARGDEWSARPISANGMVPPVLCNDMNTWADEKRLFLRCFQADGTSPVWSFDRRTNEWSIHDNTLGRCSKADLNGDLTVDAQDLSLLLQGLGPCASPCRADLNRDGVVNLADGDLLTTVYGCTYGRRHVARDLGESLAPIPTTTPADPSSRFGRTDYIYAVTGVAILVMGVLVGILFLVLWTVKSLRNEPAKAHRSE